MGSSLVLERNAKYYYRYSNLKNSQTYSLKCKGYYCPYSASNIIIVLPITSLLSKLSSLVWLAFRICILMNSILVLLS